MAKFLKIIGSGRVPCPEPYNVPYADFSDWRNPTGKLNIGDELILYAAGGAQTIFAKCSVVSEVYASGNESWPFRVDIDYEINVLPAEGVPIGAVSLQRNLGISVLRQSYIRLYEEEFERASRLPEAVVQDGAVSQITKSKPRRYFTTYWKNKTWHANSMITPTGDPCDHTAGNLFRERGVTVGDALYIVTVIDGKLFVASKMIVGKICTMTEAREILGTDNLWEANEHVIAYESTPLDWNYQLPMKITEQLRFIDSNGNIVGLAFSSPQFLDPQTLRGIRNLTPESAATIDNFLAPLVPIPSLWGTSEIEGNTVKTEFESFPEGTRKSKFVTYYERDPRNREAAINIHGLTCKGCDMNFESRYGEHGKGFIHVHHIKPVAKLEKQKPIDPSTDLTVLCPNCHAMVHRNKSKTLDVADLRQLIAQAKTKLD